MNNLFTPIENGVIGKQIVYKSATESTNTLANQTIGSIDSEGIVFIADYQAKGRGQRGNSWESEPEKNLTISVLVYPNFLEIFDNYYLSKVVANSIVGALAAFEIRANIKWPNDIYVNNEKIAGVLIENGLLGSTISHSIWGIGINVNQYHFMSDAPNPTSMRIQKGFDLDRNMVLHSLLYELNKWYELLKNSRFEEIDQFYFEALYRKEGMHVFEANNVRFRASIESVQHSGELVLREENGSCRIYAFKEVSFII